MRTTSVTSSPSTASATVVSRRCKREAGGRKARSRTRDPAARSTSGASLGPNPLSEATGANRG